MRSKVSSDWLTRYMKATRPVLEIFEMAGYFLDSPREWSLILWEEHRLQVFDWCSQGVINLWEIWSLHLFNNLF
jgi:hypothetical protein